MPPILTNLAVARVRRFDLLNPKTKSRTALSCSPEFARSGEEKPAIQPAFEPTVRVAQKFHPAAEIWPKKSTGHGRHANAALHNCHDSPILAGVEDQTGA
jgi:hypothetical protein